MWHYALFTGVMLVFFGCTVAMTRVRNAEQLYKMEPKPQPVLLWREQMEGRKEHGLLPGDLFAMRRVKSYARIQSARAMASSSLRPGDERGQTGWRVCTTDERVYRV